MSVFAYQRDTYSPSGVELCLECRFFNGFESNLVLALTSVLEIYRVRRGASTSVRLPLLP